MHKLNERQKRFVDYYLELGNMRKAALRAGYAEITANKVSETILKSPAVKEYLNKRIAEMDHKRIADAEEVLSYLTAVMRGEHDEKITTRDRIRAAELLGKRYCVFNEKGKTEEMTPVIVVGGEELED